MESLSNLPPNASVLVDANVFIYHFCAADGNIANRCSDFLLRVEKGHFQAFATIPILAETLHRAMIFEATAMTGLDPKGALNKLKKNPEHVKRLTQYANIPERIVDIGVLILPASYQTVLESHYWRENYGLLVNDSLIMSTMRKHGIDNIATNDSDFDQISEIVVWKPSF